MRRTIKYLSLLLIFTLLLSGCMKNKKENILPENEIKTITLQMRQTDSFNPLLITHSSVRDAFSLCYEPLFAINNKIETEGVLARNIEVSDDCLSAIITLKDSVLWHDGVKFTSADVVHTINLLQENPSSEYAEQVKNIDSAVAIDPLSLKIELNRPYGQIAYSLTFPIVAAHNDKLDEKIIGTGAYKFSKYTPAAVLSLVAYDKWHGGEATYTNVEINIIRDDLSATAAFNEEIVNAVTDNVYDRQNSNPKQNTRTTSYPSLQYEYMAINHVGTIFSSPTVRSAVSSAIDRSAIVQNCYMGNAMEANAPIHPAAQDLAESSILSQYNLSGASEMLFLEGYVIDESTQLLTDSEGNKLSFTLLVNEDNPERVKTAQLLSQQLFAAGIEVKVSEMPFEEYVENIESGNYEAYLGGIILSNPYDYESLLGVEGVLNNYGGESESIELALSALCSAPTTDSLSDAAFNFEEVFLREQPVCGLLFKTNSLMTTKNVLGKLMPTVNYPYRNLWNWSKAEDPKTK